MLVYLLTTGEYDDYQVHGAFTSMEDAKRAKVLWGFDQDESAQVEELEVLTIPELPKHNKTPFEVRIHAKDADVPVYVFKGWVGISSIEEGYSFEEGDSFLGNVYRFYIYAQNEAEAKETAVSYFHTLSKLAQKEQWYPLQRD